MNKTKIITLSTLASSAGLLLTACSSMHHEDASYSTTSSDNAPRNYVWTRGNTGMSEASGAQATYSSQNYSSSSTDNYAASSQNLNQNEVVIPLHEEQLNVGKQTVNAGQVTIRKIVTTETVNQPIELRRERLIIDREGAGSQNWNSSSSQSYGANQSYNQNQSYNNQSSSGVNASADINAQGAGANVSSSANQNNFDQSSPAEGVNASVPSNSNTTRGGATGLTTGPGANASADINNEGAGASANVSTDTSSSSKTGASANTSSSANESAGASASTNLNSSSSANEPAGAATSRSSQNYSSSSSNLGSRSGQPFQEQTFTIQLQEERPLINKQVVETGRVVARKNADMQRQNIQQQVRREDVQVDRGNANVEFRGNFNTAGNISEPAGAQNTSSSSSSIQHKDMNQPSSVDQSSSSTYEYQEPPSGAPRFESNDTEWDSLENKTRGGARGLQPFNNKAGNEP
jgi:stress response protein YsnF